MRNVGTNISAVQAASSEEPHDLCKKYKKQPPHLKQLHCLFWGRNFNLLAIRLLRQSGLLCMFIPQKEVFGTLNPNWI